MHSTWLLCVAGQDNPESLQRLTETLALCEGEIQAQQISTMHGRLAGLLQVRLPNQHAPYAWQQLAKLSASGLHLLSRDPLIGPPAQRSLTLHIQGQYRLGLEHEIRLILNSHRIQVDSYNQVTSMHSSSGAQAFQTLIKGRTDCDRFCAKRLQATLTRLAQDLQIDLQLNDTEKTAALH